MWADVVLEGVLGRFDALRVSPSNPEVRCSNDHLWVLANACPGSAPARNSLTDRTICRTGTRAASASRRRRFLGFVRVAVVTVVPYEYMSVGDVLNGFKNLILSSPTRVDAVWSALRPFKEGWNFLPEPLA